MSIELIYAIQQLENEKGIDKETLIEAIEASLLSAYKRNFGSAQNVSVHVEKETGDIKVYSLKNVVTSPQDPMTEISVEEAKAIDGSYDEGDVVEIEVTPKKFGRIAAQTAKQVVVQRIREAERGIILNEFSNKENDIITGIVRRIERRNVIIDLGKTEGILTPNEQTYGETYNFNDRIKIYVVEVKNTSKGPQISLSRTHPGLVRRLFELEVPEIHEGIVEVKGIAREPGSRTKIAVHSREEDVDPVGACVGQKGVRVQAVVDELRGEKIDIIRWSSSIQEFISNSLSPAKVIRVDINEEERSARVVVPDFQLSLAIGKEGQNARLAAKLTGWKIDIRSESQLRAAIEQQLLNMDSNYDPDEEYEDEEGYETEEDEAGEDETGEDEIADNEEAEKNI
ncbi:MAG: transcription termination factor NusA [Eubacteriales bacterium]|nr:transcription termination factor NusA [Eubacteriales bacterium]